MADWGSVNYRARMLLAKTGPDERIEISNGWVWVTGSLDSSCEGTG